ncbi:hypothetical protein RRG08_009453 [Elysia crispata]|uniref:Peptidase M12B domain-containing protein n=1 Tax=Elysia crispata TaxID=231223 RepID=A0AAE0XWP5_9GAST|nr:hypothetical protein RRG08_009453 [Elysia crispata]
MHKRVWILTKVGRHCKRDHRTGRELFPFIIELVSIDVNQPETTSYRDLTVLPEDIFATFICRGKQMRLDLKHYRDSAPGIPISGTSKVEFHMGDGIPVYTRRRDETEGNKTFIALDMFPRLFVNSCKTYRDYANQASVVGIQDPHFKSIKFFGSFFMDGVHFFIQPYSILKSNASHARDVNSPIKRLHVMEEASQLDFSDDSLHIAKKGEPVGLSSGIYNPSKNPNISVFGTNRESSGHTDRLPRRRRPSKKSRVSDPFSDGYETHPDTDKAAQNRQGRRRRNRNKSQGLSAKLTNSRHRAASTEDSIKRGSRFSGRNRRAVDNRYTVEVFIVCDFLCYQRFQLLYNVTDPVITKNAIAEFFSYVRAFYQTAYGNIAKTYPEVDLSIKIRVVGLYIATDASDKIIGDYVIGDNNAVDSKPSAFEFVLWVEDSLRVPLRADHYALVTGYDLSGDSAGILGLVTNIPSVCNFDRVSLNELWLPTVAVVMAHELGHSLGSQHDGLTNGFCRDEQQFIMAAFIGGQVPPENVGNPFRLSKCSVQYFQAALQDRQCLRRDDFTGSPLPSESPLVGQQFTLDQQCAAFFRGSAACRQQITLSPGSWSEICRSTLCLFPGSPELCFPLTPLEFTSCGNRKWCRSGLCVESAQAPEKPIDCPAGDNSKNTCDVDLCATSYDDVTRFIECCNTCRAVKTERFVIISKQDTIAK